MPRFVPNCLPMYNFQYLLSHCIGYLMLRELELELELQQMVAEPWKGLNMRFLVVPKGWRAGVTSRSSGGSAAGTQDSINRAYPCLKRLTKIIQGLQYKSFL